MHFRLAKKLREFERLKPFYAAFDAEKKLKLSIVETNHKFFDVEGIVGALLSCMDDSV